MPWKGYSMYFITRKTHPLDGNFGKKILPANLPTDGAHAFLELSNLSWSGQRGREVERSSESGGATLPAEVFHRIDRSISEFSYQFFLKSIRNSYTISPPLAISISWQLANLFGWKHHYSDPKLTAEEALRNGALSTNCLYLLATDWSRQELVEAMQHPRLIDVLPSQDHWST